MIGDPQNIGSLIMRLGLGSVFLIFGYDKFPNPTAWLIYIPSFLSNFITDTLQFEMYWFLRCQGLIEMLIGFNLIVGFQVKYFSVLASLILIAAIFCVGFDHIGIRDLGLLSMACTLFIIEGKRWSVDFYFNKNAKGNSDE